MRLKSKLYKFYKKYILPIQLRNKGKIFCIGVNKTGTTSLKKAFKELGYVVGNQWKAEQLLTEYKNGDFDVIAKYCKTAQVFQDFPFSFPKTYEFMDRAYPNAKFILSIRDSSEQWYYSLVKFHSKVFGNGSVPTTKQLKNATYIHKGYAWECNRLRFKSPESDPYKKEMLIKSYEEYNQSVINYFKDRPQDLLIINLAEKGSYQKLIDFLGISSPFDDFPWENKTSEIPANR